MRSQINRQKMQRLGLSAVKRVLINIAPFFTHTPSTATRNVGCISWEHLASFLKETANYHRHPDTLRKQYEAAVRNDPPWTRILPISTTVSNDAAKK